MAEPEIALGVLARLADLGVELVLDEFGSGRSSLSHLARLPIRTLALDRALVADLSATSRERAVVRAIVSLAGELGLTVAAKGVEREDQARLLIELGCSLGQGHLFGRPAARPNHVRDARIVPAA
jgi:EAL domain-containing protein (putative c-di-GMP-specific phosphodiesterase class I)